MQIDNILKLLNDAAEYRSSESNIKLQWIMMIVTILSLFVALYSIKNGDVINEIKNLIEWIRTLVHLKNSPAGVAIILFSDNVGNNKLHNIEFTDFCKEYPAVKISMKKTGGIFHDRFIVLDYGTTDERVFLCGASSKDAGARITSIVEDYGVSKYTPVIATLLKNPTLNLPQ